MKNRHIPKELFDELGFSKDTNYSGEDVERLAGISCGMQQRAKIINHQAQRKFQTKRITDEKEGIMIQKEAEIEKCQKTHNNYLMSVHL